MNASELAPLDKDDHRRLNDERDFLLRSLRDLEAERAGGGLTAEQHRRLVEDYTARAASVIRGLSGRREAVIPVPPTARRRVPAVLAVVGLAAAAGLILPSALGQRLPGQTITGNAQTFEGRDALERAVRDRPEDAAARRALGFFLMGAGSPVDALKQLDESARLDPRDAESRAYGAWIVNLAGLPDEALRRLDLAVGADPSFPDSHFFRGVILLRAVKDPKGAVAELGRYLELAPDGPMRPQVEQTLAQARQALPPPSIGP